MRKLLILSSLVGFVLGLLHAQWQWSVEVGQVLDGIVQYPHANPFYVISVKGWNIFNQFAALLLHAGVSARMASYLISGICGMLAFQACSVFIFALSESFLFSFLSSFIIFFIHGTYTHGANYALGLLGTDNTYTMTSLSFLILVIGMIGCRYLKAGFFILGLALAVHPTQGVWCTAIVMIASVLDGNLFREFISKYYRYYLAGLALTLISLVAYLGPKHEIILIHKELTPYYQSIILYWVEHVAKFNPLKGPMIRAYMSIVLSVGALFYLGKQRLGNLRFIFITFLVSGTLAAVFSSFYWFPLEHVKNYYLILQMYPGRVFNYNNIGILLLLLGLLWRYRQDSYPGIFLVFFLGTMLIYRGSRMEDSLVPTGMVSLVLMLAGMVSLWTVFVPIPQVKFSKAAKRSLEIAAYVIVTVMVVITCIKAWKTWQKNQKEYFHDYTNDAFYTTLSQRPGMLLPEVDLGGLDLAARKAVLFNGGPAILSYVPETAPEMERIFKKIYGVDLLKPPREVWKIGIPGELTADLWKSRTLPQWQVIAREFQVKDVVVRKDWHLQLPLVTSNDQWALYTIP